MPLDLPSLDNRRYQELLNEALARIPVHTPEWTNYGPSDPGRTLVELFCFLSENLLYRANQIPERNRRKFLQLLGVPLQPGAAARGIVTFSNTNGPLATITLNADLEVRAGQVPFQTDHAVDVLPVEGRVYYKRRLATPAPRLEEYYRLLYASYQGDAPPEGFHVELYEAVPLELLEPHGINLGEETVDASLWIALLAPAGADLDAVREVIQGKTVSLGIVPAVLDQSRTLTPAGNANPEGESLLRFELPVLPPDGRLPEDPDQRVAKYRPLDPRVFGDVLTAPGVVEITLPAKEELKLWQDLDPLEAGVDDFPPALEDTNLERRIVTWLRVRAVSGAEVRLLWAGIDAVMVRQHARVSNEVLQNGTGLPDQVRVLSRRPVVAGSVRLDVVTIDGQTETWSEIDDLLAAGSEVETPDPRLPPGYPPATPRPAQVFVVMHESGEIRFGDGLRGKRPPEGATLVASYDFTVGAAGNVEKGRINSSPSIPPGFTMTNPVRTWGGADAETVAAGEKQIARYLQHRERLVTAEDFDAIARHAPGVLIGRLEVLPAFHPELLPNEPGDAPGVVTLMVIPRHDPEHPDAPRPDRLFLNALCRHLDVHRLVTTEVILRGPEYVPIYISVGIDLKAGFATAEVREAVRQRLLELLAPVYPMPEGALPGLCEAGPRHRVLAPRRADHQSQWEGGRSARRAVQPLGGRDQGWPLRKAVIARELMAEASRVDGVLLVNAVLLARGSGEATEGLPLRGLQLPQIAGIAVQVGAALALDALRGEPTDALAGLPPTTRIVPVPFVPEEC